MVIVIFRLLLVTYSDGSRNGIVDQCGNGNTNGSHNHNARGESNANVNRELKHATFLSHGRQPEVNISHARTVVSPRFSN